MDTLEQRVIDFVSRQRAKKREKVSLSSRLNQDLKIDGDDAVEFFERFENEFGVDLLPLKAKWSEYFAPEGGPGLAFVAACTAFYSIGWALQHFIHWLPAWASAIALFVIWVWPLKSWPSPRRDFAPITVQDLLNSATSRSWEELALHEPIASAPRLRQIT